MKHILKVVSAMASLGGKIVDLFSKVTEAMDHVIHRKEYLKAKRRARIFRIMLIVAGGVLAVLFFPYKIVVEKNGDFEVRTLLMKVYRKTQPYDLPEGGSEEFDICGQDEEEGCEVVVATAEENA